MTKISKRKMVFQALCLGIGVSSFLLQAETVYKVVQEDGTILYTDQPVPGAIAIDLSTVNTSTMPRLAKAPPDAISTRDDSDQGPKYKVQIVSPSQEATIRDNQGQVAITATVSPSVPNGKFNLYLDNSKIASQNFGSFVLEGINRGAHTFFVSVTDNKGKTLASSEPQTFYMHQVSILTRPNGAN
jgi:hypothetical protein